MNVLPGIQTLAGVPAPERHADRVVAEMLRHMARTHAGISTAIGEVILSASDVTPRGQRALWQQVPSRPFSRQARGGATSS
jgi:hypothetical protein